MVKKYIIKKTTTSDTESDLYSDSSSQQGSGPPFDSLVNSSYIKPITGSMQDNMDKEDMKNKLIGYKTLKAHNYNILLTLPIFKTWIKYYNPTTKKFRIGGLLMKVDPELRFIMLVNTGIKKSWSVQLKDNIIFIPDTSLLTETTKIIKEDTIKQKEYIIKDKLYKMYLEGKLHKNTTTEPITDPEKIKECAIKEKLYKLYTNGKLKRI